MELDRLDEVCVYSRGGQRTEAWDRAAYPVYFTAAVYRDGARGHRGRLVEVGGLPTVVQPAYSPELSPAERVFEEVRRWVEGRVYGSIDEKVEAVNAYLRRLESDPSRVRSLAGWDWIEEAVQNLPSSYAASSD